MQNSAFYGAFNKEISKHSRNYQPRAQYSCTLEPWFNEVVGDWLNLFVKSRFRYIEITLKISGEMTKMSIILQADHPLGLRPRDNYSFKIFLPAKTVSSLHKVADRQLQIACCLARAQLPDYMRIKSDWMILNNRDATSGGRESQDFEFLFFLFRAGCRNVSYNQQFFPELLSPIYWYSRVQTIHYSVLFFFAVCRKALSSWQGVVLMGARPKLSTVSQTNRLSRKNREITIVRKMNLFQKGSNDNQQWRWQLRY